MAQHDYVIDNSTGQNVRQDINNALQAIVTNNSGSSAPSATFPFMLFADTSAGTMKIRNAADNAFIELFQLDGTFTLEDGSASTPALAFRDDLNTGIFSGGSDEFNISTGGTERFVINSNGKVGIGTTSPVTQLHSEGSGNQQIRVSSSTHNNFLQMGVASGNTFQEYKTQYRLVDTDNGERLRIDSSGIMLIGSSSSQSTRTGTSLLSPKLQISSDNEAATSITRYSNSVDSGRLSIQKGRGTNASKVVVQQNDNLGQILFSGWDGDTFTNGAKIECEVDGTPGDDDMPGRLVFFTTADGAASSTARMTIKADGKIGIGTTAPAGQLHISSGTSGDCQLIIEADTDNNNENDIPEILFRQDGGNDWSAIGNNGDNILQISNSTNFGGGISFKTGTTDGYTNAVERMRLTKSGLLGIGTSSPVSILHLHEAGASGSPIIQFSNGDSGATNADGFAIGLADNESPFIFNRENTDLRFGTNNTERLKIDSSGRVLIGTSSLTPNPGITLLPEGTIGIGNNAGVNTQSFIEFRRSGTQIGSITQSGTTGVAFNTSSDYRLKENATAISDGITRLKTLKPYRFNWKDDVTKTVDGFFAHEVTAVPEAITGTKDEVDEDNKPVYQGIDQSKLVPLLVAAVQELIGKVEALEAA